MKATGRHRDGGQRNKIGPDLNKAGPISFYGLVAGRLAAGTDLPWGLAAAIGKFEPMPVRFRIAITAQVIAPMFDTIYQPAR